MPLEDAPKRTRGKEAAREALIEAAADLFAEQGDVSVRTIAARAGVNHGLVHHYFGGKEGLRSAVLTHLAARQAASMGTFDDGDPVALAQAALRVATEDERFFRVLARALLDGDVPAPMQSAYPVVRRLVHSLNELGVEDARTRVAEGIAVTFGWMLFAPWIAAATELSASQSATLLDDVLQTHVEALVP